MPKYDEVANLLEFASEMVREFRTGELTPEEFFINVFGQMGVAVRHGHDEAWKACLNSLPHDILEVLANFAESEYKSKDYKVEEIFLAPASKEACDRTLSELSVAYRLLHEAINKRLQSDMGPSKSKPSPP